MKAGAVTVDRVLIFALTLAFGALATAAEAERGDACATEALGPGSTVAGQLVLPDGTPAAGRVGIHTPRPGPPVPLSRCEVEDFLSGGRKVDVGADGAFRFDNVPAGSYRLWATSPSGAVDQRLIEVPRDASDLRLVAQPHATVAGTVSGLADGERAFLSVKRQPDGEQIGYQHEVANGPFRISGIPNGRYTLVGSSSEDRAVDAPFEIRDLETAHVDLAFRWRSRLRGRILVGATPIAPFRMKVVAIPADETKPRRTVWVAPNGTYAINGLADARYEVDARGHRFDVHVSGDTEFDLLLSPNSISGTVWIEGERFGDWNVVARLADGVGIEGSVVAYARTDSNAAFRFDGLPAGDYTVAVMSPFWGGAVRQVTVHSAVELDFWLERPDDLQAIRVLRSNAPAQGTIEVDIRSDVFGRVTDFVPLDENGVCLLPRSLQGADLRLSLGRYRADLPRWNGAGGTVELADPEDPTTP